MRLFIPFLCVVGVSVLVGSCGGNPLAPAGDVITVVQVQATSATVKVGQTLQLTAVGFLENGKSRDVTAGAVWRSSNLPAATISPTGLLRAAAAGAVDVTASVGASSGRAHIEIVERGCEASALLESQASFDAWAFGSALLHINASRTDCRWVVDSDARWLHLDQTSSLHYDVPFSGSIGVLYYLDPNGVVSPRTAHLTVTSRDGTKLVETITQAGAPSCSYVLSPSEATFTPDGGAGSFDVTITPPTCDWTLNSNAPLYGIVPVIVERMPGFGRVAYTARRNDNLAFPHITYFEIGDRAHGNPPSRFWIQVDARPEFISRSSGEAAK